MQVYQKKTKNMIDYSGNQKISFMIANDQFDRYLRVLGHLNRSQLMRDLLMKAVREKELEKVFQENSNFDK
jgi:hypothetical protein